MEPNQLRELAVLIITTNAFSFALAWLIQDVRQAGKKLKQVREDLAETKRRFPSKESVNG
jgi:hypothetical protein